MESPFCAQHGICWTGLPAPCLNENYFVLLCNNSLFNATASDTCVHRVVTPLKTVVVVIEPEQYIPFKGPRTAFNMTDKSQRQPQGHHSPKIFRIIDITPLNFTDHKGKR